MANLEGWLIYMRAVAHMKVNMMKTVRSVRMAPMWSRKHATNKKHTINTERERARRTRKK